MISTIYREFFHNILVIVNKQHKSSLLERSSYWAWRSKVISFRNLTTPTSSHSRFFLKIATTGNTKTHPGGSEAKTPSGNAGDTGDTGSAPRLGRFHGEGNGNPLQHSFLENSIDRGAWQAIVHRVAKLIRPTEQGLSIISFPYRRTNSKEPFFQLSWLVVTFHCSMKLTFCFVDFTCSSKVHPRITLKMVEMNLFPKQKYRNRWTPRMERRGRGKLEDWGFTYIHYWHCVTDDKLLYSIGE